MVNLNLPVIRVMGIDKDERGYYRILSPIHVEYITEAEVEAEVRRAYSFYSNRSHETPARQYVWELLQESMDKPGTTYTPK